MRPSAQALKNAVAMKNKRKKTLFIAISLFLVLVISGCSCKKPPQNQYNLKLEVWGILDDRDALLPIINNYRQTHPAVTTVEYKKFSSDTYKKELLDALASGQGPDIFVIQNSWLPQFKDKIVPAPVIDGVVNEQEFRQDFVDVVADDFVKDGQIYATPLSVNTLGLFYNKDLFNQAGIVAPPKDWNQFIDDVRKLTKLDDFGQITQSGAAIGTAYNINRSTDILTLLMFQNGTTMSDDAGRASFDQSVNVNGQNISPGENALNFYTQFAKLKSFNYCWNASLHYSIDTFSEGTVAMMFNYPWHISTVKNKNPKLNFAVAPVPQFEGGFKANFANYWGYAVAKNKSTDNVSVVSADMDKNTLRQQEAWKFLTYLTIKPDAKNGTDSSSFDPAAEYAKKTKSPAARRDLIEIQKSDPEIGVFATDNLIAKSWQQKDSDSTESIFAEMIESVVKGETTVSEAIRTAKHRVNNL